MSQNRLAQCSRRNWLWTASVATAGALTSVPPLSAIGASRYRDRVLSKKPVGHWRLGESAGPMAKDESGFGRHGAYHGTPVFLQPGALKRDEDTAIGFDGKGSYVEIPDDPAFSIATSGKGLTVEAWMRPDLLEFEGETKDPYIYWLGKGENSKEEWACRFYSHAATRPNRISAYSFNLTGGLGSGGYFAKAKGNESKSDKRKQKQKGSVRAD